MSNKWPPALNLLLERTQTHTYLGVELSEDLKWDAHIHKATARANRTIGFIRRNLSSCPKETKSIAYKTLVRPTLEYCSTVWDPHTKELIHKIGMSQRRAARMVHNDYDWEHSATELIQNLKWENLSTRRKIARLSAFHKAIEGRLAIPVQNYLRPAQRTSRRSHSKSFTQLSTRKDCFKFSYVPRTIIDWNSLPESIICTEDSTLFTNKLHNYCSAETRHMD